ncbi:MULTISPECIES: hypothetical protein [Bradyrhizobium]|uniref:hypothetical protein n=1 Tax=Bradyrhizobium TaxID=374 RepID=UPI0011415936|nr:hypothetical protein [Bradyrhizobium japonicum]MCS3534987.1 hypothetical protein [Bradyrhizobium japonicum]MCS3988916.1 hypothetical protein [Bradyrhizobium japonicum]MCS4016268.1 hypothetical protein [Bradyrhizobium japonicum]MCS4203363.1 hypothetical protein [Bradyrhizobium japonicum]MDH6178036.1 hypothetical protein [Bradyrhizobium japonicum]
MNAHGYLLPFLQAQRIAVLDWHSELTMLHSIKGNALQIFSGTREILTSGATGSLATVSGSRNTAYPA